MTIWDRIADLVISRPKRVLVLALVPMVLPLLALPALRMSHDTLATLPPSAQSVQGFRALAEHLPAGETAPLVIVIDDETAVYEPAAFRALGDLSRNLRRLPHVASVRSAAMPTDGRRPGDLDAEVAARAEGLTAGLREAAGGAGELARGVEEVGAALGEIERRLPASGVEGGPGLAEAVAGTGALVAGLEEARAGIGELRAGLAALRTGAGDLGSGLADARAGAAQLRTDVVVPTDAALRRAVDELGGFTVGTLDARYRDAAEAVGEAFGRITGRFPPGHPQAGAPVQEGYDGLVAAFDELIAGLDAAGAGTGELLAGSSSSTPAWPRSTPAWPRLWPAPGRWRRAWRAERRPPRGSWPILPAGWRSCRRPSPRCVRGWASSWPPGHGSCRTSSWRAPRRPSPRGWPTWPPARARVRSC